MMVGKYLYNRLLVVIIVIALLSILAYAKLINKEPINIILITLDTVRADHLSCYGYKKDTSPNIDYFAKNGILFENTITTAPITLPAHASILTGKYPYKINVRNNGNYILPSNTKTIATELKKEGYKTAAFVSAAVLLSAFNLNQGFDLYDDKLNRRKLATGDFSERDAKSTTDAALNWMNNEINSKYFIWIHYFDPHAIYNPPEPFKTKYKDNLYDGEIAYMDSQINRIIEFIKLESSKNKFLVIVVGDHGEGLWQHGEPEHGIFLYQETLKVPFIITFFPHNKYKGTKINHLVRLVDVFPTILDFLNIKLPEDIDGISLMPILNNPNAKDFPKLYAFSETLIPEEYFSWHRLYSIQNEKWKIINAPKMELYDLKNDPEEKNNLFDQINNTEVRKLKKLLSEFTEKQDINKFQLTNVAIDATEKLKSLGYVGFPTSYKEDLPDPKDQLEIISMMYEAGNDYLNGNIKKSLKLMQDILIKNPNNRQVLFFLSEIYAAIGDANNAVKYALKNIELGDETGILNYNLGNFYYHLKQFQLAKEYYQKAYDINSNLTQSLRMLAYIHYIEGKQELAKKYLLEAINKNVMDDNVYYMLGAIEAESNNIKLAIEYFQNAVNINKNNIEAWKNLAKAHKILHNYGNSINTLKEAIDANPNNTDFYYEIGSIYFYEIKNYQEALYYFNRILEIEPNYKDAYMIRQLISIAESEVKN